MISEDYCSYEVAKLLKEKGFDEFCDTGLVRNSRTKAISMQASFIQRSLLLMAVHTLLNQNTSSYDRPGI